jgi:hypothetical protein
MTERQLGKHGYCHYTMAALKSNDARSAPILGELAQWQNYTRDAAILRQPPDGMLPRKLGGP